MQLNGVRRALPAVVVLCLAAVSLRAGAQQKSNLVTISDIAPVPGLQQDVIIPMGTTRPQSHEMLEKNGSPFSSSAPAAAPTHPVRRYPGDLSYNGGPVIPSATQHPIYMNPTAACAPNSCWGDPAGFLTDLSYSTFMHVSDQYVGTTDGNRYPVGTNYAVTGFNSFFGTAQFTNLDLAIVAYRIAAQTNGFGYDHIYHLFLVPGQDVCFDTTYSVCYSPDNPKTWYFCGYHSAVHDSAGNLVVYTVEPYNAVDGCNVSPGTPNGQLADSTNNVLSHELFETVTDPRGNAWWNSTNVGIYGEEIGDECEFVMFTATNAYFDPSNVRLNHKLYAVQPEYSNGAHACTTVPGD